MHTPLGFAVKSGFDEIVSILLNTGAHVSGSDNVCFFCEILSSSSSLFLVKKRTGGMNAEFRTNSQFGLGILHYAARQGNPEVLRMLTLAGAEVHSSTPV